MSAQKELRPRAEPREVDLDAEREVDFSRYWRALAARWWLPLAGLVAGALIGYVLAAGGSQVYRAEATLYLGQPFSPTGNAPVQSLATNPSTVARIVLSESALKEAAAESGLRLAKLRGNVSSQAVAAGSGIRRTVVGQTPLVEIAVKGDKAGPVARAANALAATVVEEISPYVDDKISAVEARIESDENELASINRRLALAQGQLNDVLNDRRLTTTEKLVLITNFNSALGFGEQRRGVVQQDLLEARQVRSLAVNVERPRVVDEAVATKTTARSTGNSLAVGGLIGLILGALAALFWDPLAARSGRPAA